MSSGFNGIRTHDLCDAGAMLYQLSYEATQLGSTQFVRLICSRQESMKVREVIPHIGPIPIVIPLKLFLDLLRDPVFPRGLTDSQSYVPIFSNVES